MSTVANMNSLMDQISRLLNMTPEDIQREVEIRRAQRKARIQRQNAKFYAALDRCTEIQEMVIEKLVNGGAEQPAKLMTNRATGNVAVMLVKRNVWNGAKGRCMTKLMMVYPDGTCNETFEKTISVRKEF